ncbi:MAG: ATP synthase F0 subunit B [Terriglobales bacterium]
MLGRAVQGRVVADDSPASLEAIHPGRIFGGLVAILSFVLLAALLMVMSHSALAQTTPSGDSVSAEHSANAALAKESRKAAAEDDEQAQFKHSWMVQWVAKLTGLSLDSAYWLCVVLNFAIVAGVIVYFSKKNLPGAFRNRTASIQKAMQEARLASEDANRRLAEIETRLSRLDTEIAGMRSAAEKEAVAEEARIKAAAEEDGRKIVESAEQEIAAAAKLARRELTTYAANLAVSLAARQIKVDPATDQGLVRGFTQELSLNKSNGGGQDKN